MSRREDHRWARRDADLAAVWTLMIVVALVWRPMLFGVVALPLLVAAYAGIRYYRRVSRWREEPPGEYWVDRIKD